MLPSQDVNLCVARHKSAVDFFIFQPFTPLKSGLNGIGWGVSIDTLCFTPL